MVLSYINTTRWMCTILKKMMNISEHTLLQLLKQHHTSDYNTRLSDFLKFIDILDDFTDTLYLAKVKTEFWKQYLEILLVKLSLNSSSLAYLIKGTPIKSPKGKKIDYPDIGSIYLLGRAQIENYLMLYYLNFQPKTFEEGEFKYLLYELSGLNNRQLYNTSSKEGILKKEKEKLEIDSIIEKIKENKYFIEMPVQNQNYLLDKKPSRIMGWEKLIEASPLDKEFFLTTWKLYSNFSHSEMIGSIQIKDYIKNRAVLNSSLCSVLNIANMIVCTTIKDLVGNFKTSEIVFNTLSTELKTKINFYQRAATGKIAK